MKIVGSDAKAKQLVEMAKRLLDASPPPAPAPPSRTRTDLSALGVTAEMRQRLARGGIVDVEGVAEADAATLTRIVGNRSTAAKLAETARQVLAAKPPPPAPRPRAAKRATKPDAKRRK